MAEKTPVIGRSIITKLYRREIQGSNQCHRKARPQRLLQKIPKRLCFRLSSLVPHAVLEEGYVFLGFTKCGQYVVSYTCQIDTNEQTALPFYQYKLQWWWFVPSRPLTKLSEVGLFGEEDILQDLYIVFCEWPEDKSQVLIFGQSVPGEGQESCQCYFTITAVPQLHPCKDCTELQSVKVPKCCPEVQSGADDKTLCLKHSFCFHSKYELTQPFPIFSPRIQLKCDRQVILNTGDSIVALHVDLDQVDSKPKGLFGENASVLKIRESTSADKINKDNLCVSPEPNKEFIWSSNGANQLMCDQESLNQEIVIEGIDGQKLTETRELAGEELMSDSESQKENTANNVGEVRLDRIKSPKSPKSLLSQNQKSPTHPLSPTENWLECRNITYPTSPTQAIAHQSSLRRVRAGSSNTEGPIAKDLYNFDSDDSEDSYSFMCPSVPRFSLKSKSSQDINISYPPNPVISSPNMHLQRQIIPGGARCSPLINNSQALNCLPFESPGVISARNHPVLQRSFFSPSNSENSFGGASSSADSVIVQVNDSRTVTHSWRKFSYHGDTDVDSTLVIEDDFDLSYRSVLPAEVRGTKNRQLPLSSDPSNDGNKEQICIKQLTFDIEHYMEEAIRSSAKWGDRYVAFTNYDLQILEVLSDRNEVLAKVFALISAKDPTDRKKFRKSKGQEKIHVYQTNLTFELNIQSGTYETLHIDDLKPIDQKNVILCSKDWKPCFRECVMLRRHNCIPQSPRCVHVLSNEAVFKGKSLQMIVNPEQYTAIIL